MRYLRNHYVDYRRRGFKRLHAFRLAWLVATA
jgi:hypothetical protein